MNERIKELAEQAGIESYPAKLLVNTDEEGKVSSKWEIPLEKFAELIVAECMNQVREQYLPVLEDEVMMKDTHWDGYVQCGVDSYVAIREHFFGVEE